MNVRDKSAFHLPLMTSMLPIMRHARAARGSGGLSPEGALCRFNLDVKIIATLAGGAFEGEDEKWRAPGAAIGGSPS